VQNEASRSAKAKHGSGARDYTLLFRILQVTGEGRRMRCSGREQLEKSLLLSRFCFHLKQLLFFRDQIAYFIHFLCKRKGSGALMGMFLSNVVFPPPASGTVTLFHISVARSQTAVYPEANGVTVSPVSLPGWVGGCTTTPGLSPRPRGCVQPCEEGCAVLGVPRALLSAGGCP